MFYELVQDADLAADISSLTLETFDAFRECINDVLDDVLFVAFGLVVGKAELGVFEKDYFLFLGLL